MCLGSGFSTSNRIVAMCFAPLILIVVVVDQLFFVWIDMRIILIARHLFSWQSDNCCTWVVCWVGQIHIITKIDVYYKNSRCCVLMLRIICFFSWKQRVTCKRYTNKLRKSGKYTCISFSYTIFVFNNWTFEPTVEIFSPFLYHRAGEKR